VAQVAESLDARDIPTIWSAGLPHDHDLEHEHDEEGHILWKRDRLELRSVGIDIGSSTSHLVFSTLELRRQSLALSSRFQLAKRRIDYASEILLPS